MTAFGRARKINEAGDRDITAEIKSVNSRYLDCTVKLPRAYSFLEEKIKAYLTERGISRGKVEIFIGVDVLEETGLAITVDHAVADSYLAALYDLRDTYGLKDDISVMSVAANRDLFKIEKPEDDAERDWLDVRSVLSDAVDMFIAAREREGANLEEDIMKKAEIIKGYAEKIKELSERDIAGYGAKLEERRAAGTYTGKYSALHHFFGYEGRCAFPSNFDADYCYSLGYNAFMLIQYGYTGYLSKVSNLSRPAEEWVAGGMPITKMMNMERRHGEDKPVIRKALVELDGAPFKYFEAHRQEWAENTCYTFPGAIQYFGPASVCDLTTRTLALEKGC